MTTAKRDFAAEAEKMFRTMREKMGRDSTSVKQYWCFSWFIDRQLPEDRLQKAIDEFSNEIGDRFDLWLAPKHEVSVEQNDDGRFITTISFSFRRVMTKTEIVAAHKQFVAMSGKHRLIYDGCTFYLKDRRLDAEELFLYTNAFADTDLRMLPAQWEFSFEGICKDAEGVTQSIGAAFLNETNLTEDDVEAEFLIGSVGKQQAVSIKFGCRTKLSEPQLANLHKKLAKAAKKSRVNYLGVEIQSRQAISLGQDADPEVADSEMKDMSIVEGVQWINSVLKVTAKFTIDTLPKVSQQIRQIHLKRLSEIGMKAADWMPTAEQRLANQLRPKAEIVKRLMASFVTTAWVCAPPEVISSEQVKGYLSTNGLGAKAFSGKEISWIKSDRANVGQFVSEAGWIMENIWSLAWLLSFSPTPNVSAQQVGSEVLGPIRDKLLDGLEKSFDQLMAETKLRRVETVIALEDLLYCAHNSVRTSKVAHGGLMHERRQPLTWALSPGVAWDETDVST